MDLRAFLFDLRYAWRGLRRRLGFMGIVLLTLALGIGVNTAVFTVFYPNIAMDKVRAMADYIDREIAPAGFTAVLAVIFGVLALLLAATGIYGVLNYQVSARMPEMGIRMALGASAGNVLSLVFREAFVMAATGAVLGVIGAQAAAHWLASLLYGISPGDLPSYGLALLLLPSAALLGCWRPACRAASANPADTIREE